MAPSELKIPYLLIIPLLVGTVITQEKSGEAAGLSEVANSPAMYSHWLLQILKFLKFLSVLHYSGRVKFLFRRTGKHVL